MANLDELDLQYKDRHREATRRMYWRETFNAAVTGFATKYDNADTIRTLATNVADLVHGQI